MMTKYDWAPDDKAADVKTAAKDSNELVDGAVEMFEIGDPDLRCLRKQAAEGRVYKCTEPGIPHTCECVERVCKGAAMGKSMCGCSAAGDADDND